MEPLVSIVIPVYNTALDLARCIESVRRQSYTNIEVMLVNDGSEDSSLAICGIYDRVDARFRTFDRPRQGVSAARNHAMQEARGIYMQFVDSDDYLEPDATRLLVQRAEETKADMVISRYWRVNGEQRRVHGYLSDDRVMDKVAFAETLLEEPASFYYGVMWNKLYRSELIRAHRLQCSEQLKWCEDFLFNLEYIRYAERFATLSAPIYNYVKNRKGLTTTAVNLRSVIETKARLFPYYKGLYESIGLYEKYRGQIYKYLIAGAKNT